ncbi:MAG TPA: hypothetical protein VG015_10015 [Candidatus Dormibacteraeota bacterium]|jgi:hypothetical protein|nr:hypothetical protein [Candidatus Dormibacteraeota bacterium]
MAVVDYFPESFMRSPRHRLSGSLNRQAADRVPEVMTAVKVPFDRLFECLPDELRLVDASKTGGLLNF